MKQAQFSLRGRMRIFGAMALLGLLLVAAHDLWSLRDSLIDARKKQTRHVVEVAYGLVAHFHSLEKQGALPPDEARKAAKEAVRALRYDDKEYFWINDMSPKSVLHPLKPEQEGKDMSEVKDGSGLLLYKEFVRTVQEKKEGFVFYEFVKPDKSGNLPKISYVKGFEPWGWVIGSGVLFTDIDEDFWFEAKQSFALIAAILIVLILISRQLIGAILRQLGGEPAYAAEVVSRIAEGELTHDIKSGNKPLQGLLLSMKTMQDALQKMIGEISACARDARHQAAQLSASSQSISTASERTNDATAQAAAAIEELTVSIQEVSSLARASDENSSQAAELSVQGEALVEKTVASITSITDAVNGSSQQIQKLMGSVLQIGTVANVIKEIADQTNLLALNAAIEAARAGEQGRGFAVVADEVRKLAERTTKATAEIGAMIGSVQTDTQQAVAAMDGAVPLVELSARLAADTASLLGRIKNSAQDNLAKTHDVAHATQEQASVANSIAQNIEAIAEMVQRTHDAIQETSATARDLEQVSQTLGQAVSKLRIS